MESQEDSSFPVDGHQTIILKKIKQKVEDFIATKINRFTVFIRPLAVGYHRLHQLSECTPVRLLAVASKTTSTPVRPLAERFHSLHQLSDYTPVKLLAVGFHRLHQLSDRLLAVGFHRVHQLSYYTPVRLLGVGFHRGHELSNSTPGC